MASRIKLKLPSFSVTKRSTSGRVSHHFVPRGCDSVLNPDNSGSLNPDDSDSVELTRGLPAENLPENLPTLHEVTQKRAVESWNKIRWDMLQIAIESEALPEDQPCGVCSANKATHRCLECGPRIFFCLQCYEAAHSRANIFHIGEMWKVKIVGCKEAIYSDC